MKLSKVNSVGPRPKVRAVSRWLDARTRFLDNRRLVNANATLAAPRRCRQSPVLDHLVHGPRAQAEELRRLLNRQELFSGWLLVHHHIISWWSTTVKAFP